MYEIITLDKAESTNTYLKSLTADGTRDLCVIAKRQTGGRGRLGRTFESPEGGLYMSFIYSPDADSPGDAVTARAAVAAARAIERLCGVDVGIKWVNDVYAGSRKLAGILAEGAVDPATGKIAYLVIGIGVNLTRSALSPEVESIAVSVEELGGCIPEKEALARAILEEFESCTDFFDEYRRRQILLGKAVTAHRGLEVFSAIAEDLADDCSMILRLENGERVVINSGEISLRVADND